jgi:hypothetical protein
VFTARYALSPYIKQTRIVFKGLILFGAGGEVLPVVRIHNGVWCRAPLAHGCECFGGALWVCLHRRFEGEVCSKQNLGTNQPYYTVLWRGTLISTCTVIVCAFFEERCSRREYSVTLRCPPYTGDFHFPWVLTTALASPGAQIQAGDTGKRHLRRWRLVDILCHWDAHQ